MNSLLQICGVDVSSEDGTDGPQRRAETSEHHRGLFEGLGRFNQEVSSDSSGATLHIFSTAG